MLTRTKAWFDRMHWPASGQAALGFGLELWETDPSGYEGYEQLRTRVMSLGRRMTPREYAAELSGHLLSDVLVAIGGVEQARADFQAAVAGAQAWTYTHATLQPGVPHAIQNEDVIAAWCHLANVLAWARAVEERIDRAPRQVPKGSPPLRRQGLLPAIKPKRLKKRAEQLFADLKAGPMGETRLLDNRTLHAGLVRHSFSGADVDESGRVLFPIPDRITAPTYHWQAFTWQQRRDAGSFVDELWATLETFFNGMLDAYEKAIPRRLRRERGQI